MGEAKGKGKEKEEVLASVRSTLFKESESIDGKCVKIEGYDFNQGVNYPLLLSSMVTTGFQASNLGDAIQVVNQMVLFNPISLVFSLCAFSLIKTDFDLH